MAIILQRKGKERTSLGKNVKKLEPMNIAVVDVKWCSHSGKLHGGSKKLDTELQYDPASHF